MMTQSKPRHQRNWEYMATFENCCSLTVSIQFYWASAFLPRGMDGSLDVKILNKARPSEAILLHLYDLQPNFLRTLFFSCRFSCQMCRCSNNLGVWQIWCQTINNWHQCLNTVSLLSLNCLNNHSQPHSWWKVMENKQSIKVKDAIISIPKLYAAPFKHLVFVIFHF